MIGAAGADGPCFRPSARSTPRRSAHRHAIIWPDVTEAGQGSLGVSVASGTRIVACRNLGLVGQRVALPPGSQPYGDSDYARNDEPRPQRPERARPPDERQHLAKGYHDEDPRALGESLDGIHAHTYCRLAWLPGQRD